MSTKQSECLLEEFSPNGNIYAVVEQDENTCYFYLHGGKSGNFGLKSCWVRNLGPAPRTLDTSAMRKGIPPMLPRAFCKHSRGGARLDPATLSVVWAEEGDAAALFESGQIIAVIPSWSGQNGFHGYARDCIGESPLCWELGTRESNVQFERYDKAAECWKAWADKRVWPDFQDRMVNAIEQRFGKHSNYYAIDGGKWPPKALLRIPCQDSVLLITVGMALRPQPQVELHYENPELHRRIELAVSLDNRSFTDAFDRVASYISGQSDYPWSFYTFLGDGHTMPADAFAQISGNTLPYALLQLHPRGERPVGLPIFREDPINLLWVTPVSDRERTFAQENGSTKLADRLREQGFDWRHSFRRSEVV
jgi:hypothetical protein